MVSSLIDQFDLALLLKFLTPFSQMELYSVYQQIIENKEEAKLIELVKSGTLSPDSKNAEGQTPLMIAVEAQFSI